MARPFGILEHLGFKTSQCKTLNMLLRDSIMIQNHATACKVEFSFDVGEVFLEALKGRDPRNPNSLCNVEFICTSKRNDPCYLCLLIGLKRLHPGFCQFLQSAFTF